MEKKYLFLALGLTLCAPRGNAQVMLDSALVVLTWNIRLNIPSDGINAWPHRKEQVAAFIRSQGADLCGFQEALRDQIDDFASMLPEYGWCGGGRDDGNDAGEFSPILYRKDRFRLISSNTFWLSETPNTAGSKGWDAQFPRIATCAELDDKATGKRFTIFNTHFDHVGEMARRMSARQLLDSVRSRMGDQAAIVTGDFNAGDTSQVYRLMTGENFLSDALHRSREPHEGPMSTWNGFREIEEGRRIDYIFVNKHVDVLSHTIHAGRRNGLFLSDHLPVIARVVVK